ncbi:MAG: hypothetical protein J7J44_06720 [Deltaproteobacteria bacterium]|nr:hypothetical protein [Deltaproteobacteria bacterium]
MKPTDTRVEESRDILKAHPGLWRCHNIFNCVEACPKGLNPLKAIVALRKFVLKS